MTYSDELSIAVEAGRATVRPGDRLTYTTTVRNLGADATPALDVSHTLAPGLVLVSDGLHWTSRIPAKADARFTVTVDVAREPGARPLTVTACVTRAGDGTPLVCASGSAAVQAGAPFWWGAAGVLVVLVVVALLVVLRMRYPFDRFR
ncbi:DUF11 domain-containing protein [Herbidospora daliensis]|uniref:DUF11 domain-containing protein n=1 Tax=Herbidospora daliensis TaxID=295585 RepID=UPI00078502C7|nr:DUF11 domain-containing protein [Herbidospora daliensis]